MTKKLSTKKELTWAKPKRNRQIIMTKRARLNMENTVKNGVVNVGCEKSIKKRGTICTVINDSNWRFLPPC